MKRRFKFLFIVLFSVALLILFSHKSLFRWVSNYLSYTKIVNANVLVVEGWISEHALSEAYREFTEGNYEYIVTTGFPLPNHLTLFVNAFMVFHPHDVLRADTLRRIHEFAIHTESSLGDDDSCHFVFYINDERITDRYTFENRGRFKIPWEGRASEIDSVMVRFDNDIVNERGDRNLRIVKFEMNGKNLIMDYADVFLDRGRPFGERRRNVTATTYAELAAHYFTDRGIPASGVIPVFNPGKLTNRTYGNALALRNWLEKREVEVNGINIVSMEYHSRRTWLTYRSLTDNTLDVGIITVTDLDLSRSRRDRYLKVLKESVAMIYYGLFVLPWV